MPLPKTFLLWVVQCKVSAGISEDFSALRINMVYIEGQLKYRKNNFKILGQKFRDKDLVVSNSKPHHQEASVEPRDQKSERSKNIFVHGHKFQNPFYTRKMLVNLNKLAPRSFSEEKARGHQRYANILYQNPAILGTFPPISFS